MMLMVPARAALCCRAASCFSVMIAPTSAMSRLAKRYICCVKFAYLHRNFLHLRRNLVMKPQFCLVLRHIRHFHSSNSRHSTEAELAARDAAARLLDVFSGRTVSRRQLIDGNQLQKLSATLGKKRQPSPSESKTDESDTYAKNGTPLSPGHHLVYFTPDGIEAELGPDGSDMAYGPGAPFSRRMWAGGTMQWPATQSDIRVGDVVEERTTLLNATAKKSRSAGAMVLVEVQKELEGPRGVAVVDRRSWIFRPQIDIQSKAAAEVAAAPRLMKQGPTVIKDVAGSPFPERHFCWSPVGLFRFSALTFNGHKIHYDHCWTNAVEGHPGVVVHGPLHLINILDYWQDIHARGLEKPQEISYRAVSPLYAGDQYKIHTIRAEDDGARRRYDIVAQKDAVVCVEAQIYA